MPEERGHWTLTDAGRREAERILRTLNQQDDDIFDTPKQVVS
jgi:hypothetical protein